MDPKSLHRQRWVRLAPDVQLETGDACSSAHVARWVASGYPAVIARSVEGDLTGEKIRLGIPLPNSMGRARIALTVPLSAVVDVFDPPSLSDVRLTAPFAWRRTIDRLATLARAYAVDVHVFGSLAWETVTGLDYLRTGSDLDVLFRPRATAGFHSFLTSLRALQGPAVRLDGECWRRDGAGVHWRELLGDASQVVAKTDRGLSVMSSRAFLTGVVP